MSTFNEENAAAEKELKIRVARNLDRLIHERNLNKTKLCRDMAQQGGMKLDRSTLSKFLNAPEDNRLTLPLLVSFAQYFKIPVDALLSENIVEFLENRNVVDYQELYEFQQSEREKKDLPLPAADEVQIFVENPSSPMFFGYIDTDFYCYYFSNVLDEYQGGRRPIIAGKLKLYSGVDICRAEFTVNTKKKGTSGKINYKKYTGKAVLSTATNAIHCSLRGSWIGEYCYIIFRYSKVNFEVQDCRLAFILSTASTPEKRDPVIHRMFISRVEIKEEDLALIEPFLQITEGYYNRIRPEDDIRIRNILKEKGYYA